MSTSITMDGWRAVGYVDSADCRGKVDLYIAKKKEYRKLNIIEKCLCSRSLCREIGVLDERIHAINDGRLAGTVTSDDLQAVDAAIKDYWNCRAPHKSKQE